MYRVCISTIKQGIHSSKYVRNRSILRYSSRKFLSKPYNHRPNHRIVKSPVILNQGNLFKSANIRLFFTKRGGGQRLVFQRTPKFFGSNRVFANFRREFSTKLRVFLNKMGHSSFESNNPKSTLIVMASTLAVALVANSSMMNDFQRFFDRVPLPSGWKESLFGGLILGISVSIFMLGNGRVTGMSGLLSRVLDNATTMGAVQVAGCQLGFLSGLLLAGVALSEQNDTKLTIHPAIIVMSGILVGLGTRIGSGCTSGHGICGLARRSWRSLSAVTTFMGTGFAASMFVSSQYPQAYEYNWDEIKSGMTEYLPYLKYGAPLLAGVLGTRAMWHAMRGIQGESLPSVLNSMIAGTVFGTGLYFSNMTDATKIRDFTNPFSTNSKAFGNDDFIKSSSFPRLSWDISLAFVMGGALAISMVSFPLITSRAAPLFAKKFNLPTASHIDKRLILGSALFGTGWGACGLCPGPAILNMGYYSDHLPVYMWMGSVVAGMMIYHPISVLL